MSVSENDMQSQLRQTIQQLMQQYGALNQKGSSVQSIDWSKLSADDLRQVLNASVDQQKQGQLNQQLLLANQIQDAGARNPNQDRGQAIPTGSVYLPPDPLTKAVGLTNQLGAIKTAYAGQGEQSGIDTRNASLPELFRKLLQRKKNVASTSLNSDTSDDDETGSGDY